MREILFRGKRADNEKWIYGLLVKEVDLDGSDELCIQTWDRDSEGVSSRVLSVIPSSVGQYTGLTDKNGIRIFENDIVLFQHPFKNRHGIYLVSFFGSGFNCEKFYQPHFDNPCDAFSEGTEYFKVIGNIYDTPELLKENNNA